MGFGDLGVSKDPRDNDQKRMSVKGKFKKRKMRVKWNSKVK